MEGEEEGRKGMGGAEKGDLGFGEGERDYFFCLLTGVIFN